jgi:hypothetical protein
VAAFKTLGVALAGRARGIYLLLAETAHSLRDYGYDINIPHPPIKVSPPAGPRRFAGMNPDDIDDPIDRETYKKAVDENTVRYQKHEREHNLEEWISKYVSLCRGMLRAQSKTESARARLVKTVCTTVCEEKLKKKLLENMILESLPKETPSSIDPQPVTP